MPNYTVGQKVWVVHHNTPVAYIIESFTQRKGELCCVAHNFNNPKLKVYLYGRDIYEKESDALKVVYDVWKQVYEDYLQKAENIHTTKMAECEARLKTLENEETNESGTVKNTEA